MTVRKSTRQHKKITLKWLLIMEFEESWFCNWFLIFKCKIMVGKRHWGFSYLTTAWLDVGFYIQTWLDLVIAYVSLWFVYLERQL